MVVKFELIGGPFDGQDGLQWSPSVVDPLPMVIRVGYCKVVRRCGEGDCPGPQHIHFWMSNERAPDDVVEYALELMTAERATYVHEADGLGATELMLSARSPIAVPMAGEE